MKGMSKRMKMNLQFFADPESDTTNDEQAQVEESQTENEQETDSEEKETSPKKYSRDDVGKMVAAETKKAVEKAKKEWEKTNSNDTEEESSGQNQNETSAQEKLAQKEAELAKKEIRLEYREKAQEEGLPLKIIDLIDCSDAERAEASFELAKEILGENTSKKKKKQFVSGGNPQSGNPDQLDPFLAGLKGK
ncbi:hypothetical protein IGJ74_001811 [Enterococcus sp. AZ009]|uniref:hypothetical protein n=1 Tax=Enterococcus TaxID=1350 RepID=UPI001C47325B|nr:hypothetical protein [Enterococcus casseliflavus]